MSRKRENDCCEYREERRRLALKKLRNKTKETSKDLPNNRIDDHDEDQDDETKKKRNCEEKQARKLEKLAKLISLEKVTMGRIKPSIEDRDKYSMDARHIRCFLEPAELEKLEIEEKTFEISKIKPCDSGQDPRMKKTKVTRPLSKKPDDKVDKKKSDEDDDSKDDDDQRVNDESRPEMDEQTVKSRSKGGRKKRIKGEFWCTEVRQKVDDKLRDSSEDDEDCSDSICSFDSHINLSVDTLREREYRSSGETASNTSLRGTLSLDCHFSGLSLTVKDMKKIHETRRNRMILPMDESKDTKQ